MENTLENKAKFFALYLGQRLDNSFYGAIMRGVVQQGKNSSCWKVKTQHLTIPVKDVCLPLTPLSQITDEDANSITIYGTYDKASFNDIWYNTPSGPQHYAIDSVDFLRSKGYAMRWMGVSVETLVEWGWVKLTPIQ